MPKSTKVPPDVYEDVLALDTHRCAWCWTDSRDGAGQDVQLHHRITRARARNLHDVLNCTMLCIRHHAQAHSTARWPWLVEGSTLRGRYVGADAIYTAAYNGGPTPTHIELAEDHPEASAFEVAWALHRLDLWRSRQA